ncbi:hypothetical protein BX666DRAFT_1813708, partial [Dichotomocladium elegans]
DLDDIDINIMLPQTLKLDLRGKEFSLQRDVLVNLPESLLIAMFPNGLLVGKQDDLHDDDDGLYRSMVAMEDQVSHVDFDPLCLEYVLKFYEHARATYQKPATAPPPASLYYPLLTKQPILVLKEELEYYCIRTGGVTKDVDAFKLACGQTLKKHDSIFDSLQRNNISHDSSSMAEQHLIDLLCDAGFGREDRWGYREMEPRRTCIISMALTLLKTMGADNHMAIAQKLLMFWRRPARRCWWDRTFADVQGQSVRLWARKTWTLELTLV